MKPGLRLALARLRFWLMLALLFASQVAIVGIFFLSIRLDLEPAQRALLDQLLAQRAAPMLLLAGLLLMAQGIALKTLISRYLAPMWRMAEEVVLLTSHPGHRIVPAGARETRDLAGKLNQLAETHQRLHEDVQARVEAAGRALAEEKDRLAALMAELAQSVLVCNLEGRILLYNNSARALLDSGDGAGAAGAAGVGLGRSLFGVLERGLIVHALEQIEHQLGQPAEACARPLAGFVTTLGRGRMVRAHMAPVLDAARALNGFVLTLEDITRNVEADNRRDALQQLLTQDTRATLANIRAAVETMQGFPGMSEAKRAQFTAIIDDESQRLACQIERAEQQHAGDPGSQWQLEEMRGADLLALLARRIDAPTLEPDEELDGALWLKIDSYTLTQALAHLAHHLMRELGVARLRLGLRQVGRLAHLELRWSAAALAADTLRGWESEPLQLGAAQAGLTLAAVIAGQGGATVYRHDPAARLSCYRVLLPLAPARAAREQGPIPGGRPEFYDFDLFHQAGQNAALDQRPLSQLSYTVFDTETTGLHPAGGDEIISIGALRIVNGRLLEQESFDQLVQPGMFLSAASSAIHGINDAMLKGRPEIGAVLPQFHRFAEDTVLVAHNAAFDMKFLQMKEEKTGIAFRQPVLDTLLLSQVIHPHQEQHSLEAIARRLGVNVVGRHTALGDAMVTGAVFLKMLPLLAEKGIVTLKQAREAEQQTAYASIRY